MNLTSQVHEESKTARLSFTHMLSRDQDRLWHFCSVCMSDKTHEQFVSLVSSWINAQYTDKDYASFECLLFIV